MCQLKQVRGEAVSHGVEEGSCDGAAIDSRGSYLHEVQESDFEDGVNVVYTYSSIDRLMVSA
jgi:hypothetical protein